jgi:hypothetical protein
MAKRDDEFPLAGCRTKLKKNTAQASYVKRNVKEETHRLYKVFGKPDNAPHPSKPIYHMLPNATTQLTFSIREPQSYERKNTTEIDRSVFDISKELYGLIGHTKQTLYQNLTGSPE